MVSSPAHQHAPQECTAVPSPSLEAIPNTSGPSSTVHLSTAGHPGNALQQSSTELWLASRSTRPSFAEVYLGATPVVHNCLLHSAPFVASAVCLALIAPSILRCHGTTRSVALGPTPLPKGTTSKGGGRCRGEPHARSHSGPIHIGENAQEPTPLPTSHARGGGGGSQKSDILLKTPQKAKFKKGGAGFKGVFCYARVSSAGRAPQPPIPRPPPPPNPAWWTQNGPGGLKGYHTCTPNEIHSVSHIVSGTSEQLGMQRRCVPTIRTAPTNVYCSVSSAWVFRAMGTENSGLWVSQAVMGLEIHHGVRNAAWGEKCINGRA